MIPVRNILVVSGLRVQEEQALNSMHAPHARDAKLLQNRHAKCQAQRFIREVLVVVTCTFCCRLSETFEIMADSPTPTCVASVAARSPFNT